MPELSFIASEANDLLTFLQSFHLSKKNIQELFTNKSLAINGMEVIKNVRYEKGDLILIDYYEDTKITPFYQKLDIVYEDEDILAINKPINLLVHPDGNSEQTLDNMVFAYYLQKNNSLNPRHLHRLDKDTSGLVLYAKHLLAHAFLNYQIEKELIEKHYYAIVQGEMEKPKGIIELPIGRNRHESNKYLVNLQGKSAVTIYHTIKSSHHFSLLDVVIKTGRTHQIRVHFAHFNHPVVGDKLYGKPAHRLMLHAYGLDFIHPRTRNRVSIRTRIPDDFLFKSEKS
ncbi:MAG: RluA family pseudouridine synthase [Bacilli bacterium]